MASISYTVVSPPSGGGITVGKTTALIGNYPDKVSGTGWATYGDATVTLNQCASTYYRAATCDAANQVTATLGTSTHAGTFKNAFIKLAVGGIDSNGDTCGLATSVPCYIVAVGNTGDATSSAALGFTLPSITLAKTTGVLGNYVDAVKTAGIPIGDTVTAQECDASVAVPATVSTHCDAATQISGTSGASGKVVFSPTGVTIRVGSAYSGSASGPCQGGRTCNIGVIDTDNADITASVAVALATPTFVVHKTTAVLGNYLNAVKATGFPIGDTVTAQECDSSVVIPTSVASNCDAATQISGTAGTTGVVTFSPTRVTMAVGGAYSDGASGTCPAGGTCDIVVDDSGNPTVGLEAAVTFAAPTGTVHLASNVPDNYVDKVTAQLFPIGDTVTAQECDANMTSANLATHCDSSTQITGTVGSTGTVTWPTTPPLGVTIHVGNAFSDTAGGTCPAGGTCDVVINDSTHSGFYLAVPVGLAG